MYIVNALVRSVQLFKVFGKRTNHILTVIRNLKNGQAVTVFSTLILTNLTKL